MSDNEEQGHLMGTTLNIKPCLMFSVVINCYNYSGFVGLAIESILNQTFKNYELIVVDDGSIDNSLDVIEGYGGDVKVVRTNHVGQARACLEAIEYCSGEYIYILDADDEACPNLLEVASAYIHPGVSKMQFQMIPIGPNSEVIGDHFPIYQPNYTKEKILDEISKGGTYTTPQTSGNIFHRSIFGVVGDIDYEKAIDGITLFVAPFLGEVISIGQALARYRVHGGNQSITPNSERFNLEATRFVNRNKHLKRILTAHDINFHYSRPLTKMYVYVDRLTCAEVLASRVGLHSYLRFVVAAFSQLRLRRALGQFIWLSLCLLPSRELTGLLMLRRANPWSPLKSNFELMKAVTARLTRIGKIQDV